MIDGVLVPQHDWVLVSVDDKTEEKTPSGLILPGNANDVEICTGVIEAVGPGIYQDGELVGVELDSGDRVLFRKNTSLSIETSGGTRRLLRYRDVLCEVNDE